MANYSKSAYHRVTRSQRKSLDTQIHSSSRVEIVHYQLGNPTWETQPSAGLLEMTSAEATPELYNIQPLPDLMMIDNDSGEITNLTNRKQK